MYNVIVYDDDENFLDLECRLLRNIANKYSLELNIISDISNVDLMKNIDIIEKKDIHMIVLDIDMPGADGFTIAEKVNEKYPDTIIIFLTNQEHLVFNAFEYNAFRFIRKSTVDIELRLAVRKAVEKLEKKHDGILNLKTKDFNVKVKISEIVYFTKHLKNVVFVLEDGRKYIIRDSLKNIEEKIKNEIFIKINSGCVINSNYIQSYNNEMVTLENGETLYISRDRWKKVRIQIKKVWG